MKTVICEVCSSESTIGEVDFFTCPNCQTRIELAAKPEPSELGSSLDSNMTGSVRSGESSSHEINNPTSGADQPPGAPEIPDDEVVAGVARLFKDLKTKFGSRLTDPEFLYSDEYEDAMANAVLESTVVPMLINRVQTNIQSIADSLILLSDENASYLPFLDRLRLITTHDYELANARARAASLGEFVEIPLGFAAYVMSNARLAALALMGNEDAYTMMVNTIRKLEAEERAAGFDDPIPIPVWKLFEDSLDVEYIEVLATNIYMTILTWIILHEIAHHLLGHLDQNLSERIQTLPDAMWRGLSREQEFQADQLAFQQMDALGYSLVEIFAFMVTLTDLGRDSAAAESAHPTWSQRRYALRSQFDLGETQRTSQMVFYNGLFKRSMHSESRENIGNIQLAFPRNPNEFGSLWGGIVVDEYWQWLTTVVEQGQTHLYTRTSNGTVKIVIESPDRVFSKISLFDVTPDGRETCFRVLQHTFQSSLGLASKTLTEGAFVLARGGMQELLDIGWGIMDIQPDKQARVDDMSRRHNSSINELVLRYVRSEISTQELERLCSEVYRVAWQETALELGPEWSAQFKSDFPELQTNAVTALLTAGEAADIFHDLRTQANADDTGKR